MSNQKKVPAWILIAVILILLFPVQNKYKDGGTKTYTALTYKVIIWNKLNGKHGTEIYLFPQNYHSLDYYDHN